MPKTSVKLLNDPFVLVSEMNPPPIFEMLVARNSMLDIEGFNLSNPRLVARNVEEALTKLVGDAHIFVRQQCTARQLTGSGWKHAALLSGWATDLA